VLQLPGSAARAVDQSGSGGTSEAISKSWERGGDDQPATDDSLHVADEHQANRTGRQPGPDALTLPGTVDFSGNPIGTGGQPEIEQQPFADSRENFTVLRRADGDQGKS
jgi:hypothetical protein